MSKTLSRKAKVKIAWTEQGPDTAFTLGRKLKLKDSTLRAWLGAWRREAEDAKPAPKKVVKSKPTPKAKAKVKAPKPAPEAKKNGQAEATTST